MEQSTVAKKPHADLVKGGTAIDDLLRSQKQTAYKFELCLMAVTENPTLASKIRIAADDAQKVHSYSLECMVKSAANSRHILEDYIPMIHEGVEIEEMDLVTGGLEEIMTTAQDMVKEVDKIIDRYGKIGKEVMEARGCFDEEKQKLTDLDDTIEEAERNVKKISLKVQTQDEELAYSKESMTRLTQEKKSLQETFSSAIAQEGKSAEGGESFFSKSLFPVMAIAGVAAIALTGCVAAPALALGGAGVLGVANKHYEESKRTQARQHPAESVAQKMHESEVKLQEAKNEQREQRQFLMQYKQDELDKVSALKKLILEKDRTADVSALENASKGLGDVYEQLLKIKQFWTDISTCIDSFTHSTSVLKRYVKVKKSFLKKLEDAESNWKVLNEVFECYVRCCKGDNAETIIGLYKFLSEPINFRNEEQRAIRATVVAGKCETLINNIGLDTATAE